MYQPEWELVPMPVGMEKMLPEMTRPVQKGLKVRVKQRHAALPVKVRP
jgi:hypothetical protein